MPSASTSRLVRSAGWCDAVVVKRLKRPVDSIDCVIDCDAAVVNQAQRGSAPLPGPTQRYLREWDQGYHYGSSAFRGAKSDRQASTRCIGVFLKTDQLLPVSKRIQIFINWPVLLDQRCPLRLVMTGRVLRSDEAGDAVGKLRYDFKIRPSEHRGSQA